MSRAKLAAAEARALVDQRFRTEVEALGRCNRRTSRPRRLMPLGSTWIPAEESGSSPKTR